MDGRSIAEIRRVASPSVARSGAAAAARGTGAPVCASRCLLVHSGAMKLSKLALTVTEDDISTGLEAALKKVAEGNPQGADMMKKIKNPKVKLSDGMVIFKCKASMGILPVPIEAKIRLAPADDGQALDITLAKVSMAMMGGEMIAGQLMSQLAAAVAGKPGLSVYDNTLRVAIAQLAQLRGIELGGRLNDIAVVNGTLSLDFS